MAKDKKGVSNLYKCLHAENNKIITDICTKWSEKAEPIFHPFEEKNSFVKKNVLIDDIYLKYIQFRTLHYRFYTNDLLLKCKISTTDICSQCKITKDSNPYMLLYCTLSNNLLDHVERWIRNLGMENYHLTDRRKILGDLENANLINIIILNTKKVIYLAKLEGKPPSLTWVQASIKAIFEHEQYKGLTNNNITSFEKKWSLLLRFLNYNAQ